MYPVSTMHLSLSLLVPELTWVQLLVFRVHRTAGMKFFKKQTNCIETATYSLREIPMFRVSQGSEKVYKFCRNLLKLGRLRTREKNCSVRLFEFTQLRVSEIVIYCITQVILAFWLVLAYDLLEDRCTLDVTTTKVFPLCFKMAESFEKLDNILHDWENDKYKNVSRCIVRQ